MFAYLQGRFNHLICYLWDFWWLFYNKPQQVSQLAYIFPVLFFFNCFSCLNRSPCSHSIPVPRWHLLPSSSSAVCTSGKTRISVGSFSARAVWAIFSLHTLFHQATPQRAKCILYFKATSCASGLIRERSANLHAAIFHLLLLYFQTLLTIINPALWLRRHKSAKSVCTHINLCRPSPSSLHCATVTSTIRLS